MLMVVVELVAYCVCCCFVLCCCVVFRLLCGLLIYLVGWVWLLLYCLMALVSCWLLWFVGVHRCLCFVYF